LLTATNIRTGYLSTVQFRCGGGTNEDIYFEDSGIRLYDASSNELIFARSGYSSLEIWLQNSTRANIVSGGQLGLIGGSYVYVLASAKAYTFHKTGTLQFPSLSSAPTAHEGDVCVHDEDTSDDGENIEYYINGAWLYTQDSGGW
jgi:hypothetical protein